MMRHLLLIVCFHLTVAFLQAGLVDSLLHAHGGKSQESQIDLLIQIADSLEVSHPGQALSSALAALRLSHEIQDEGRIIQSDFSLSKVYLFSGKDDSAMILLKKCLPLADRATPPIPPSQIHTFIARILGDQGRYDSAEVAFQQAIQAAKEEEDQQGYAIGLYRLGVMEDNRGNHAKATEYIMQALEVFEQENYLRGAAFCYNSLGTIQNYVKKQEEAVKNYERAFALFDSLGDQVNMFHCLNNIGSIYLYDQPEKARSYVERALELSKPTEDGMGKAAIYTNLAALAWKEKKMEEALEYDKQVLAIYRQYGNQSREADALNNVAYCYREMKRFDEAESYALQALKLARQLNARRMVRQAMINLSTIYKLKGNFEKAYAFSWDYIQLNDSLTRESNRKQISELQVQYETDKKEQEIELLTQQKQLQEVQLQQRNLLLGIVLLIAGLIVVIAMFFYQRQKIARQANDLAQQKIDALEQERQLTAMSAMIEGQESERTRIARDLHDGLGGLLSSVKLRLSNLASNPNEPDFYSQTDQLIDEAAQEVRRIAHNMVPGVLIRFGLAAAINTLCETIRQSGRLDIEFQGLRLEEELPLKAAEEAMIYRIVQELVQNVLKHAQATEALVQLARHDDTLEITIEDDGVGFDPKESAGGLGIQSIKARVSFLNGTLSINSEKGQGSSFLIYVPLL